MARERKEHRAVMQRGTPRKPIASMRGTEEFSEWIQGLVEHVRMPISVVFEHALIQFAKAKGFRDPPPNR
jgi:hypothetical protein